MKGRLFLVYPTVVREVEGELEIEFDFCESLRLYLDNFDLVSVACPLAKETGDLRLLRFLRVKDLPWRDRIKIIPLPKAYRLAQFLRHYSSVRQMLKLEIQTGGLSCVSSPHVAWGLANGGYPRCDQNATALRDRCRCRV